jgi:hypothetical protein
VFAAAAAQQTEPTAPPPANAPQAIRIDDLPWPVRLGVRASQVERAFPIIDRVVLVPDAATYVDELSKWTAQGRWPVLFEDDRLAAMFIRRFDPSQVIRRKPVEGDAARFPTLDKAQRQAAIEAIVVRACGGNPATHSIRQLFDDHTYVPAGIVIASLDDPAWTAAAALAAGRALPIAWFERDWGWPDDQLSIDRTEQLAAAIEQAVAATNYAYRELGDAIDAIALCRSVAGRGQWLPHGGGQPQGRAITDAIGRSADNHRFALTGWIFGDEKRAAYVAMSSIFLPREKLLLIDTYPNDDAWMNYDLARPAEALQTRGFEVTLRASERATHRAWIADLRGGLAADVILMNSRGLATFFELFSGRGSPGDMPILNTPAVIHLTHSWSAMQPNSPNTIGGRLLERGVYAYVGAVEEPRLGAFVPPMPLVERLVNSVPLAAAARHWTAVPPPVAPEAVQTFGDPLLLVLPPAQDPRVRLPAGAHDGTDVLQEAQERMRTAGGEGGRTEDFATAIRDVALLGRDEIATELWRLASQRGLASPALAELALPSLFRMRAEREFLQAWDMMPSRTPFATDMLWHLFGAHLISTEPGAARSHRAGDEVLLQLQSAIRRDQVVDDVVRLLPSLQAAFGGRHASDLIQREIERAADPSTRQALQQLIGGP